MAGGIQKNTTHRTSPRARHARSRRGRRQSRLLLKQRQKRGHALAIFGRLVRQRFINSAIFKLAGSFIRRMKQFFQSGWKQQHVPRQRLHSESTPSKVCAKGLAGSVTSNKNPCSSQSSSCGVPQQLLGLDFNGNAKTHKRPDQKRPRGRPRRAAADPAEKSRHKQDKPKCGKSRCSGAKCQRSTQMSSRRKTNAAKGTDDKVVQSKLTEMVEQPSVGTLSEGTKPHKLRQTHRMNSAQCANVAELSATGNCVSQSQNAVLFVNGINSGTKRQKKRKPSTRLKYKAVIDVTDAYPKKNARTTRSETKPSPHQQITKSRRTRHETERPVTQSNPNVGQSNPNVWQSNPGFIANQENSNDWPSLAELGRPKHLTKEVVTKMREPKYAGASVRDAGNMLTDVINVESRCSGANMDEKDSRSWTVHQQCASNSSQKTWASVAAQSSTGPMRTASKQRTSENHQPCTQESMEITPVGNSTRLSIRKPPIRSKLAYSLRFAGDHSMIKEKPPSGKFTERQETTKFLKTIRSKNKNVKRFGQKDNPVVLGAVQEKRKQRKGERFDKMHDNGGHAPITHKPKSCWKHNWKVDEMCKVYACSTPPILSGQAVSESDNSREPQMSATEGFYQTNNAAFAADSTGNKIDAHSGVPTNTCLMSENALSDNRDVQRDVAVAASSSSASCFETKTEFPDPVESEIPAANVTEIPAAGEASTPASFQPEIPAPVETENRSPKKVSLRYRALLRGDCSHVGAKTLTEMQTRNKKTNHLHDSKVATRNWQRQQRQERQTSHHAALRFHTSTCADGHSQDSEPGFANSRCSYWLRSMHEKDSAQEGTLGNTQSNGKTARQVGGLDVTSTANTKLANLTPCRTSGSYHLSVNADLVYNIFTLCVFVYSALDFSSYNSFVYLLFS
ncbi:hypothetical protein BsWGS_01005 [Bradybaena similaris]